VFGPNISAGAWPGVPIDVWLSPSSTACPRVSRSPLPLVFRSTPNEFPREDPSLHPHLLRAEAAPRHAEAPDGRLRPMTRKCLTPGLPEEELYTYLPILTP
jgi:hypothetical protein